MEPKKKILFLIPSLETGGSQKVLSILLNNINKKYFETTLCLLTERGEFFNDISNEVNVVYLDTKRVRFSVPKIYSIIKSKQPDIVFVFDVNNLNLIVGILSFLLPSKIKYVTRESCILSLFINDYPSLHTLRRYMYRLTFKRFQKVVCQSNYMKTDLVDNFNVAIKKITVINNPVDTERIELMSQCDKSIFDKNTFNMVAVGRIVPVKGFDRLIKSLAMLEFNNYHLTILGAETPEHPGYLNNLNDLLEKFNMKDKVTFLGNVDNPHIYTKQCDLMVITSRTEGFPNVALEATLLGTPVLAFNSPGGISEIVVNDLNGWLIDDGNLRAFSEKIVEIKNLHLDKKKIRDYTVSNYNIDKIVSLYENQLLSLLE